MALHAGMSDRLFPDKFTLLHNPRCSKSRAAKALLEERGVAFRERLYLEAPLSAAELRELSTRLARPAAEWVRNGEPAYKEAGLGADAKDNAILAAMARHPILIERPILIASKRAVVGRPPERVLELLD
jgi:arsenate reductase